MAWLSIANCHKRIFLLFEMCERVTQQRWDRTIMKAQMVFLLVTASTSTMSERYLSHDMQAVRDETKQLWKATGRYVIPLAASSIIKWALNAEPWWPPLRVDTTSPTRTQGEIPWKLCMTAVSPHNSKFSISGHLACVSISGAFCKLNAWQVQLPILSLDAGTVLFLQIQGFLYRAEQRLCLQSCKSCSFQCDVEPMYSGSFQTHAS